MAYIRSKVKKGHRYYYVVESRRDGPGGRTRQHTLEYIGPERKLLEAAARWRAQAAGGAAGQAAGQASFRSYGHGATAALWKAASLVGLETILDDAFPGKTVKGMPRGRVLLLEVLHRACDPGGKAAFAGWCAGTSLPYHLRFRAEDLDSRAIWEAMDGISEGQLDEAQRAIVARLGRLFPEDLSTPRLDYSNYHTWIDSRNERCVVCRRGHNKQRRNDLRQFSLAMLTASSLEVPLVWDMYEGNRNDKTEFPLFVEKVEREMGGSLDGVTVCFDGGGNSAEALSSLPFHFVCAHSMAAHKDLYDVPLSEFGEVELEGGHSRLARRVDGLEFSGVTGTGVLTISEDLRRGQEAELERREGRLRKGLERVNGRLANPRSTLFAQLRAAEREARRDALEAEDHNRRLEADKAEGRRTRCRPKATPGFDEEASLLRIVEGVLLEGAGELRGFWSCSLSKNEEGRWKASLTCDDEARKAHCDRLFGRRPAVTDHTDWTTGEILSAYAEQEVVEDMFRTTKDADHFSMRPQYHWTDDKIRVHVFLCLCAVMLAEVLRRLLADQGLEVPSKASMLDRLAGIRDGWVVVGDMRPVRTLERMGAREARLWEAVVAIEGETLGAG